MIKNELAYEILNEGMFPMCMPLLKLKAMSTILYNVGSSPNELSNDEMRGVAEILNDISCELQDVYDEAHAIYDGKGDEEQKAAAN